MRNHNQQKPTSWQHVSGWYHTLVGSEGHYYHEHVVIPGALRLLNLDSQASLLDLGCGQGILARHLPTVAAYTGWDASPALIETARRSTKQTHCVFAVRDVTKPTRDPSLQYTHAAVILALQNMEHPEGALQTAAHHLQTGGRLLLVLNHPCFRIPRQSGWDIDEKTKQQYRWENRYASPMKIPIEMHPGRTRSSVTWSFHHSLHDYSQMLLKAGFVITSIEEWTSTKESVGTAAKMENRARSEFPLFLALLAQKK